jgi:structural maintenance of chromosome 1
MCRSQFEEEQLKLTQSRLVTLRNTAEDEQRKVEELEDKKRTIQVEITEAQEGIAQLRELLHGLNDVLEEKNKHVEQAKKTHTKAAKILDQALKEIGLKVRWSFAQIARSLTIH